MKKLNLLLLALALPFFCQAQLVTYPGLPNNKLKSAKYSVRVKLGNAAYQDSYTYAYLKNAGTGSSQNNTIDPYNVVSADKRNILSNNHWTTVSYNNNGNSLTFEVSLASGDINTCEVYPKRYNLTKTVSGGKAYITVDKNKQHIYLVINNDKKDAMFLFVDPLETNIPTATTAGVAYFGPGLHVIGERWQIPANVNTVYIAGGAYVRGTIEANNRSNITIRGRGILSAEGYNYRSGPEGIPWGAIHLNGNGTNQVVEGITSMKPLHFHVTSRGGMTVRNIKCFSFNNTTDGVVGGTGTLCENSFFKVNDDVTKLYSDNMIFQDLVVYHQTNTPCFQFGWSGQSSKNCTIRRIDIVEDNHVTVGGGGIIGWASSNSTSNFQTGHVWTDVRADQGVSFIMDVNSGGSQGKVDITLNDFQIALTKSKSVLGGGNKKVVCNNVKIAGECVKTTEWSDANSRVTIDCSTGGGTVVPNIANLTATSPTCSTVVLTWSDVTGEDAYRISRKTATSTYVVLADVVANSSTYVDETAEGNTSYQYIVHPMQGGVVAALSNTPQILTAVCSTDPVPVDTFLRAFPNPTTGILTLPEVLANDQIKVVSQLSGLTVLSKTIQQSGSTQLNISNQPAGSYTIQLVRNNQLITRQIVKL